MVLLESLAGPGIHLAWVLIPGGYGIWWEF
jgi:hypothetical protein